LQRVDALRNGKVMNADELKGAHSFAADQVTLSLQQVGWFVLIIAAGTGTVLAIMCGAFAGKRATWAGVLLGIILVGDLARADFPYIMYWNYQDKYEVGHPE